MGASRRTQRDNSGVAGFHWFGLLEHGDPAAGGTASTAAGTTTPMPLSSIDQILAAKRWSAAGDRDASRVYPDDVDRRLLGRSAVSPRSTA